MRRFLSSCRFSSPRNAYRRLFRPAIQSPRRNNVVIGVSVNIIQFKLSFKNTININIAVGGNPSRPVVGKK